MRRIRSGVADRWKSRACGGGYRCAPIRHDPGGLGEVMTGYAGRTVIVDGVEDGFAVARAARSGQPTTSGERGRVLVAAYREHRDV